MQSDTELDWQHLAALADKVARNIAAKWPVVEKDDVKQEIMAHAYEFRLTIEAHYSNEGFLWAMFHKAGTRYASRERNYRDLLDDQYYYTPDEAKKALATFLYTDEELAELVGKKDDLLQARITDNVVSARVDAGTALKKLSFRYQQLLLRRFVHGLPVAEQADRMALSRAVVALSHQMNRSLRTRKDAM